MQDDILISIIVSTYNSPCYLDRCISSIINQTYKNIEIILINDSSIQGEPVNKYVQMDGRINIIYKKNEGIVSARKAGLNFAKGDYIAFIDGNDWIDRDMYQMLLNIAVNEDADFVDSSYLCEKDREVIKYSIEERRYNLDDEMVKSIIESWICDPNNVLIGTSIETKLYKENIIKLAYSEVPDENSYGEDYINYINLFRYSRKAYTVSKAFYHFCNRNDSLSHLISIKNLRERNDMFGLCIRMIMKYYPYINQNKLDVWYFKKALVEFHNIRLGNEWDIPVYKCTDTEALRGQRMVIYGAGNVGKDIYAQLSKCESCKIVAWVDKNYPKHSYSYCQVQSPDILNILVYDILLIAVLREKLAESIRQELVEKGVTASKITWKPIVRLVDDIEPVKVNCNFIKFTGGLGNQMFQYAFYRSMQEHGINVKANIMDFRICTREFELLEIFPEVQVEFDRDNKFDSYKNALSYHELYCENRDGIYDCSVFNRMDTSFIGYWQTEKYFYEIADKIRKEFTFNINDSYLIKIAKEISEMSDSVSLHVRRGDYLQDPGKYGGICTTDYYMKAIEYIKSKVNSPCFFIFSDDLKWVRDNLFVENAVYMDKSMFKTYRNWYDMYLMTCCKHNVIANSSFSWWGAWLNSNEKKIVVAPKKWLNGEETFDIWPSGWIKI